MCRDKVSPFLHGSPPGPVKIAYNQGVSLTRGGSGSRLSLLGFAVLC